MWFNTWPNTWLIHNIFKKQTNLILLLSDSSSLTHYPSSETSIEPTTLVASRHCHLTRHSYSKTRSSWLTDVARLLQILPLSSSTLSIRSFMNADDAVPLAHQLIAKLFFKPIRAWLSLSLAYQLIPVLMPSRSGGWVRKAFGHQRGREWSGKRMAGWTQSENLLLGRQHQLLSIGSLLEVDSSQ